MKKIIKMQDLTYQIPYGKTIFEHITFDLHEGELLGVLGRNGVGKTTLIDLCLGLRNPTSGSLEVLGENPLAKTRKHLEQICYIAHDSEVKFSLTVKDFLKFYATMYPHYNDQDSKALLDFFNIDPTTKFGALSTGQRKKVLTIAALSTRPKLLLVDEITAVLDPESRNQFFTALNKVKSEYGTSIILATNIAEDLIDRADHILFINEEQAMIRQPNEIMNLFFIKKAA